MGQLIPGVEADVIPGVGHLLGMQRPDIVNERILRFIGATERVQRPA